MSLKHMLRAASAAALVAAAGSASAGPVVSLNFDTVGDNVLIGNYYNGSGGAANNFGVTFSDNAFAVIDSDAGGSGNIANEPSPNGVMYFIGGTSAIMNYAAGFDVGFSFLYSSFVASTVNVYSGLNGTGTLLLSINILNQYNGNSCQGDPNGEFCNWSVAGGTFNGIARSISFGGAINQTAFDNVTFGSTNPGTGPGVPEPASLALVGAALLGLAATRRSKA